MSLDSTLRLTIHLPYIISHFSFVIAFEVGQLTGPQFSGRCILLTMTLSELTSDNDKCEI